MINTQIILETFYCIKQGTAGICFQIFCTISRVSSVSLIGVLPNNPMIKLKSGWEPLSTGLALESSES